MRKMLVIGIVIVLIISSVVTIIIFSDKPDKEQYEETTIDIDVMISLKNLGQASAFNIPLRLAIPQEQEPYQFIETLEFSEEPERRSNDSWDNEYIHYTFDRIDPQNFRNISFKVSIKLMSIDYNIKESKLGEYSDNYTRYLAESSFINVNDPDIINLARKLAKDSDNILDIAWNTYEWIIDNIYYQQIPGEWDARTTLKNREGGSAELGNLFVALLRANNIPSRRLSGWGNHFEKGEDLALTRFSHGWTEFYLSSYGWIPVDPTWGKVHKFENFAKTDADHIVITKGAGNHYFWRGPFDEPFGETEIDTDYRLVIKDVFVKNLSVKRDIITVIIFSAPFVFAIFIIYKKLKQRRI